MNGNTQLTLFGADNCGEAVKKRGRKEIFEDYEGYIAKFQEERPKTTDDTFTPPDVFDAVVGWLRKHGKIAEDTAIVRPFYPGGDFETADYPDGCAVVDNPPFSMLARIVRWFISRNVPFFLFAPGLTIGYYFRYCTTVIVDASITFENNAKLNISFVSNMFGDAVAIAAGDLQRSIEACTSQRKEGVKKTTSYAYPHNVVTPQMLRTIAGGGGWLEIGRKEVEIISKVGEKEIFGRGSMIASTAKAVEAKAVEAKAVEAKAVEAKAVEAKAVEAKAVEAKAVEAKAVEAKAVEAKAVEAKAVEAKAVEAKAVEAKALTLSPSQQAIVDRLDRLDRNGFLPETEKRSEISAEKTPPE